MRAERAVEPTRSANHHGDLAALGGVLRERERSSCNGSVLSIVLAAGEFGYRSQQLTPVTERHPDLLKV